MGGAAAPFSLRHDLRPGDLGTVIRLHGTIYAREQGFDPTFEAYVAGPLSEFVLHRGDRERLFLAEREERIVGSIAIVKAAESEAQLRWYLVDPSCRGLGLGTRLVTEAIAFARGAGYRSIFLWTVAALGAAARIYRAHGFGRVESNPGRRWGVEVSEEKYSLSL